MTEQVFRFLDNLRQLAKDEWANGTFTSSDIYGTLQLNSEAIGKARLLEDLLEMNYEWVTEELSDARE